MDKNIENKNEIKDFVIDPNAQYSVSGELLCQIRATLLNSALSIQGLLNLVEMAKPFVEGEASTLFHNQTLEDIQECEINIHKETIQLSSEELLESIMAHYEGEEFYKMEGMDDAIIGVYENPKGGINLIYSVKAIIETLSKTMSHDEAVEHIEFNILRNFFGSQTPIFANIMRLK